MENLASMGTAVIVVAAGYWLYTESQKKDCSSHTCTNGTLKSNAADIACEENECDDATCCATDETDADTDADTDAETDTTPLTSFTKYANKTLYPLYGLSDLKNPDERTTIIGASACAQACLDDPTCIAFHHLVQRHDAEHTKENCDSYQESGDRAWMKHENSALFSTQGQDISSTDGSAVGTDWTSSNFKGNVNECKAKCESFTDCKGFSMHKDNTECWFKNSNDLTLTRPTSLYDFYQLGGEDPCHPEMDKCYFWSGPQAEIITPTEALQTIAEEAEAIGTPNDTEYVNNTVVDAYILKGKEDWKPSTSAAETINPYAGPPSQPSGTGFTCIGRN